MISICLYKRRTRINLRENNINTQPFVNVNKNTRNLSLSLSTILLIQLLLRLLQRLFIFIFFQLVVAFVCVCLCKNATTNCQPSSRINNKKFSCLTDRSITQQQQQSTNFISSRYPFFVFVSRLLFFFFTNPK